MANRLIKFFILILTLLLLLIGYQISKYETAGAIVQEDNCITQNYHPINLFARSIKDTTILFSKYIQQNSFCDINNIKNDIQQLDSIIADANTAEVIINQILTEKLYINDSGKINNFDLILLAKRIQWAEKFRAYSELDRVNQPIFESVYMYWMDLASNTLQNYSLKNQQIKYSYLYRYLVDKCIENRFSTPIKMSKYEKFIYNLATQKWGHLIDASWNQASLGFKIVFFLVLIITLFSYYSLIEKILKLYGKK